MPGFCGPHIVVAAVAIAVTLILLPTMMAWLAGWHMLGAMAVATLTFSGCLWASLQPWSWFSFVALALYVAALLLPFGKACMQQLLTGPFDMEAAGLLTLGAGNIALAVALLFRLTEDMPDYQRLEKTRSIWVPGNQKASLQGLGQERPLAQLWDWMADQQTSRLMQHAENADVSWWSRICRWQLEMITGWWLAFWIWRN